MALLHCGDPPSMWQMCEVVVGLTAVELGNLLAGLHPRDVKHHGYVLTRLLCTLRYLEAKSERMFSADRKLHEIINAYKRSNALTVGRRVLEVQGLRDSLAKAQKEL